MGAVLKYLMPTMSFYYPAFAARFGTDENNIGLAMREYADRLQLHGVTGEQFMAGLELLKSEAGTEQYFPNPEKFALTCKVLGVSRLPDFSIVLDEIIQRRGKERFNQEWNFSHELIRLINNRKGDMANQLTSIEFERAIKSEYDHWLKRIAAGESLPEPLLAIEQKPEMPDYLKGVKPAGKMAQRVEQMRQIANERKAAEQLASVHKA